jgi:hypothetical protein
LCSAAILPPDAGELAAEERRLGRRELQALVTIERAEVGFRTLKAVKFAPHAPAADARARAFDETRSRKPAEVKQLAGDHSWPHIVGVQ